MTTRPTLGRYTWRFLAARDLRLVLALSLAASGLACAPAVARQTQPLPAPRAQGQPGPEVVELGGAPSMGLSRQAEVAAVLGEISAARIRETDSMLVSFGTRHTMSDTLSGTRGIGAARHFLHGRLLEYSRECGGCLHVEYDPAMVTVGRAPGKPQVNVVNVLAWLPGRDTSRVVVMGGHYDSCVCSINPFDSTSTAPGADDDGSGASAIVELARVFSRRFPRGLDATVIFAAYAGEEQGLLGSTHLASRLHAGGYQVVAGMTDDIIGNVESDEGTTDSSTVRIFGGDTDNSPSRALMRYVWGLSQLYTAPSFTVLPVERLDRIQRGGDHIPFARYGDPALRFTERLENYKRQHLPTDDFAHVNFGYVTNVARLNGATVAALGMAPPVPDSARAVRDRASGGQKWLMSWKPSPGAVAYEVLVRRTTSPTWERLIRVGNTTSFLLPDQLDDTWAAVRAVGSGGARSLAASVPPPAPVAR